MDIPRIQAPSYTPVRYFPLAFRIIFTIRWDFDQALSFVRVLRSWEVSQRPLSLVSSALDPRMHGDPLFAI
jgi:hypothetical protein